MSLQPRPCLATLALVLFFGCSADTPPQGKSVRTIDYELFASTHELRDRDLDSLSELGADGTLRFDGTPAALEGLKVGEVLLSGVSEKTPQGLLRVVLAIDEQASGALVLRTASAPLQLAFRKLHARVAETVEPFAEGAELVPAEGANAALSVQALSVGGKLGDHQSYQVVVFDGDDSLDTENDQVVLDASLGGGFDFELRIDVDWDAVDEVPKALTECALSPVEAVVDGELPKCSVDALMPELTLGFEVSPYLDAEVKVSGAATVGFSEAFDVGTITLPPITLGPLVLLPSADIVATIEGRASARFSASAHANIETSSKVVLSSKVENSKVVPFEVEDVDADAETPEIDLYAEASAKPGVRFTLALYGVLGPYAQVSAVAKLLADPLADPCWDLGVGIETQLGVLVKTPSLPVVGSYTFLDWSTGPVPLFDESVASGTCTLTAEGRMQLPPGSGPNAATLQKPPFTPWAKLLGTPADASDLESVLAYPTGFPFLVPSVDGRYVAGGGGAQGLVKLDGDGNATWSGQVTGAGDVALRSVGSVPSADAGLLTVYRPRDSSTFVLVKQTQGGALEQAVAYDVSQDCGATVQALARDGDTGFVVVGECAFLQSAWLVHVDADLSVLRARRLYDADENTGRLTPTVLTRSVDGLVIAGELIRQGEAAGALAFVQRVGDDDELLRASAYACPSRLGLYPTAVIPSLAGNLTLIGDASGIGYVMRLEADGSLGFVHFPNLGGGIQAGFTPNAVVELPTTGMVIASTVSGLHDTPADLILVGLDGNGRTQWGREYTLHGKSALRALGWPSARLTDDGGILVTATAGPEDDGTGELFGMKVYARDGTLPDGPLITSTELTPQDGDDSVEMRPISTKTATLTVTEHDFDGSAMLK